VPIQLSWRMYEYGVYQGLADIPAGFRSICVFVEM
jgi:hypothetical protein